MKLAATSTPTSIVIAVLLTASGLLGLPLPLSAQSFSPDRESVWTAAGFGAAIAIGDGEIFVGRTGGGVAGAIYPSPGSIYVFERAGDGWEFAYVITGDDVEIGDEFGAALAVEGDRLLVGSPGRDGGRGGAQVFERGDDGQWVQRVEFVPPADGEIRGAGTTVALSGDAVFLGAPSDAGPGVVLRFPAAGGSPALLPSPTPSTPDRFGASLSLDGDLLFVGAPGTGGDRGAAYAFHADFPATDASPTATLALPEGRGGDAFGTSLTASGAFVLVGAPGADAGAGAAILFTRGDDGEWRESARLSFPEEGPAGYGSAVAFDGRSAWVGASGVSQGAGGAQVFRVAEAAMALESENTIPAPGFSRGALFGSFVALRDDVAVVAASNADMRLGAAVRLRARQRHLGRRRDPARVHPDPRRAHGRGGPLHRRRDRSLRLLAGRPGRLRAAGGARSRSGHHPQRHLGMDRPGDRQGLGAGRALGRHGLRRHQQPRQPPLRRGAAPDRGRHREPLARHQGVPRPRLHRSTRRRGRRTRSGAAWAARPAARTRAG